jgi:hypothetical protein
MISLSLSLSLYSDMIYFVLDSESESHNDWRFTANQFVLATGFLRTTTRIFFPPTEHLRLFQFQFLLVLASAVIHRSESRGTHDHILLSLIRDSPNLEGQVPLFISPRNMVAQLYPPALDSPFIASYDSQG